MADEQTEVPESSAVRVALWRAMHLEADAPPHVLEDGIGLQLAAPGGGTGAVAPIWTSAPPAGSGHLS